LKAKAEEKLRTEAEAKAKAEKQARVEAELKAQAVKKLRTEAELRAMTQGHELRKKPGVMLRPKRKLKKK